MFLCELVHSGSGSTCLISSFVMLFVALFLFLGGIAYVEVCRGIIYDDSKGSVFKVTLSYYEKSLRFLCAVVSLLVQLRTLLMNSK